jgi:hypothetical protein
LREYYEEELKQKINDNYYTFPQKINEEMAMDFLEILEFSFHIIMEYSEEKEIRLLSKKDKTSDFFEL